MLSLQSCVQEVLTLIYIGHDTELALLDEITEAVHFFRENASLLFQYRHCALFLSPALLSCWLADENVVAVLKASHFLTVF